MLQNVILGKRKKKFLSPIRLILVKGNYFEMGCCSKISIWMFFLKKKRISTSYWIIDQKFNFFFFPTFPRHLATATVWTMFRLKFYFPIFHLIYLHPENLNLCRMLFQCIDVPFCFEQRNITETEETKYSNLLFTGYESINYKKLTNFIEQLEMKHLRWSVQKKYFLATVQWTFKGSKKKL